MRVAECGMDFWLGPWGYGHGVRDAVLMGISGAVQLFGWLVTGGEVARSSVEDYFIFMAIT